MDPHTPIDKHQNEHEEQTQPSTKMKSPILFKNGTDDYAGIVNYDYFYKFWQELEELLFKIFSFKLCIINIV